MVPPLFTAASPQAASVRAPARVRDNGRSRIDLAGVPLFAANSGGDFDRRRERFAATTASLPVNSLREEPGYRLLVSVFVVGDSITQRQKAVNG